MTRFAGRSLWVTSDSGAARIAVLVIVAATLITAVGFLGLEWHSASDKLTRLEQVERTEAHATAVRLSRDETRTHAAAVLVLEVQIQANGLSTRVARVESETGSSVIAPDGLSARLESLATQVDELSTELGALRSCINESAQIARIRPIC